MPMHKPIEVRIPMSDVSDGLPNFHTEFGHATIEGREVRFIQHINGSCFWLTIGQKHEDGKAVAGSKRAMYVVKTQDLMNAILNKAMPLHLEKENDKPLKEIEDD